jgi:hypothetical protein
MAAKIGLGTTVAYESATPGTYTSVGEVFEFEPPTLTMDTVESSDFSHTDGYRRYIGGLIDGGEITFTLNFDPAGTIYGTLETLMETRAVKNWKFVYAGSTVNTIASALVTSMGRAVPRDDRMTMSVTLKVAAGLTEAAS